MELCMFNVIFRTAKSSAGSMASNSTEDRQRCRVAQESSIFTAQANYTRAIAECRNLCLLVQHSKVSTDKLLADLAKIKKQIMKAVGKEHNNEECVAHTSAGDSPSLYIYVFI